MNVLPLILLWSLVEVHSQTPPVPYLTFMGETLPDHSYVDLSTLGVFGNDNDDNHVVCYTDLATCCGGDGFDDRGFWFSPNGTELPGATSDGSGAADYPIVGRRLNNQRVRLIRGTGPGDVQSGIYRCDIETVAVNTPGFDDGTPRETVYVGVYNTGGMYTHNVHYTHN